MQYSAKSAREVSDFLVKQFYERKFNPSYVWGIPTGFDYFDHLTGGIQNGAYGNPSEMVVLAARPNVGKSAFAGYMALNIATRLRSDGASGMVRIVSLEMGAETYLMRMACALSGVPMNKVRAGFASPEQESRYKDAMRLLRDLPIEIWDRQAPLSHLAAFLKTDNACAFWILDHIGIVQNASNPNNPTAALSGVSTYLAEMCHTIAPGMIISHLNRQCEMREDKRPKLADLYGADRIGQDADLVLALYRDSMYVQMSEEDRELAQPGELIILKSRNGTAQRTIHMIIDPKHALWIENDKLNRRIED